MTRHQPILFLLTCAAALSGFAEPLSAQELELRVTWPGAAEISCPVERIGTGLYIAMPRAGELFRAMDAQTRIQWDASSGVYRVEMTGREFSLFRQQNILLYNKAMIDTGASLIAAGGQMFVPLVSLREIFLRVEGLDSNINQLLTSDAPALPPIFHSPGADATSTAPEVDISAIVRDFRLDTGEPLPKPDFDQEVLSAARSLLTRRVIVIDPEIIPALSPSGREEGAIPRPGRTPPGADLTFRVAKRCAQILARHSSLKVVLTREDVSTIPTLEERLLRVNESGAKALICLRVDRSPFPANAGYRLFTVHEAVDPDGRSHRNRLNNPEQLPLAAQYLPFENLSLALAQLLDTEMTRGGLVPAREKMKLAPAYLMKRAAMPSVLISLGYATNAADAARFQDERYVESAARSLAQGLLVFDRWLEASGWEMRE